MKHNPDSKNPYFDKEAYDFIRSISTPDEEAPHTKPHKKRYAVIFLIIFSVMFVAVVRHTYSGKGTDNNEDISNYEYFRSHDINARQILTEEELDEALRSLAAEDSRYKKIYENKDKFPKDMLQAVCKNPEIVDFAAGYLESDGTAVGGITEDDLKDDVPLFIQWDSRWGYVPYGDNIIGLSGCGPTCLSMAAVALTGDTKYSPDYIANFAAKHGYYEDNAGTIWTLFTEGCESFGLHSEELPLNYNDMVNALEDGKVIICSMNPGDFTAVGHFIVIRGISNGDFIINDPNSRSKSLRRWSYEELEWQIRNLWAFE